MNNETDKNYQLFKAWNTKANLPKIEPQPETIEQKEKREFLNFLFDKYLQQTEKGRIPAEYNRTDVYIDFMQFVEKKSETIKNGINYIIPASIETLTNNLTDANWNEFLIDYEIKRNMNKTLTLQTAEFIYLGAKGKANIIEYREMYKRLFDAYIQKLQLLNETQKANSIDISIQTEQEYLSLIPTDKTLLRGLHEANIIQLNELKGIPETAPESTSEPIRLIKSFSENQQKFLNNKLTESGLFLPTETDLTSFCYVFGNSIKPKNFKPLKWLQNKQLLRELITALKHPDIEISKNKYNLPAFFIDKMEKPILYLPTNKPQYHILNNRISKITKNLATS